MFKKLKDKKGFTLVELIVVLVILAILAALLIPALTGYIDKANKGEGCCGKPVWSLWLLRRKHPLCMVKVGAGNDLSKATSEALNDAAKEAISLAELSNESVGAYAA